MQIKENIKAPRPHEMFSLTGALNGWANNRSVNDLRRRRSHYDVTIVGSLLYCSYKPRYQYVTQIINFANAVWLPIPWTSTNDILIFLLSYLVVHCAFLTTITNAPAHCLVQDCSDSSALAMEFLQSCTKPSICNSNTCVYSGLFHLCAASYLWYRCILPCQRYRSRFLFHV